MNADSLREFLGWCTVINCSVLLVSSILMITLRDPLSRFHARRFHLEESAVRQEYVRYLATYKLAILVLNLVPYLALCIMG